MIEQGLETLWYVDRHRMFQKHPMSLNLLAVLHPVLCYEPNKH